MYYCFPEAVNITQGCYSGLKVAEKAVVRNRFNRFPQFTLNNKSVERAFTKCKKVIFLVFPFMHKVSSMLKMYFIIYGCLLIPFFL